MSRLERWIARVIAERPDPGQQQLLHRYAVWHVIRRLRARLRGGHATHGQVVAAQRNIKAAVALLDWLTARDLTLATARPRRPGDMAGHRAGHPPHRRRELRPLGTQAQADQPGLRGHPMGRTDRRHRHRDPLGTSPLAAARRHAQTRGPRRRAARPALRPAAVRDQPAHPRPRPGQRRPGTHPARPRAGRPARAARRPGPASSPPPGKATPPSATRAPRPGCSPAASPDGPSAPTSWPSACARSASAPAQSRSAALFQLATDLPAAVLARMLGIHIAVAVAWQRACRRRLGRLRRRGQPPQQASQRRSRPT